MTAMAEDPDITRSVVLDVLKKMELEIPRNSVEEAVPEERTTVSRATRVTQVMAGMELTDRTLMRSARTHASIWTLAASLGKFGGQTDLSQSFVVAEIDQFWSHSWHGSQFNKLLLVLAMKNGLAAVVAGTLAGLVAMIFFIFGYLPAAPRPVLLGDDHGTSLSLWSTAAASAAALLTLAFWRRSENVFLDCLCVDQKHPSRKAAAIANIGAFLRHSRKILVMWDHTFCGRLWCMFEARKTRELQFTQCVFVLSLRSLRRTEWRVKAEANEREKQERPIFWTS